MTLATAAVLAYAALAVTRIVPSYVTPQYTIRQVSREIGRSLAEAPGPVATSKAEGLFNGNALPYRTVLTGTWPSDQPAALLVAFGFHEEEARAAHGYRLAATYRLIVSPEYAPGPPEPIRVYRREPGAPSKP